MQTHHSERTVVTTAPPEFIDITHEVDRALESSLVSEGLVTISVPTGCAIVVNEYESGLISDLKRVLGELKRSANGSEPSIGSSSVVLPAAEGRLRLGRWQRLMLVELEKSTDREVNIQVVGE